MTDEDVLRRFCKVVGCGQVVSRDYDQAPNSTKRVFKWGVYDCTSVRRVLALFMPYLGKRRTAKACEVLKATKDVKAISPRRKEVLKSN
jgi:hypothetical protein